MILRETQNQNDADDANDAESGIWYRDIPKTASQASSASLSSRKNSAGVWGTPQKCVCGYPNAMLAKHVYPKTMTNKPDTRTNSYMLQSESLLIHPKILTRKSESVLIHFPKCCYYGSASLEYGTYYDDGKRMISERYLPWVCREETNIKAANPSV